MVETKREKTKATALVTYLIVLVCMIAVLFIPVFGENYSGKDTMLIQEIPAALFLIINRSITLPSFFTSSFSITSYYETAYSINLAALAVVIYAVAVVLGIILLIPIIAGKSQSAKVRGCAYAVEIITMLALSLFAFDRLTFCANSNTSFSTLVSSTQSGYILFALLAVIWLLFTVQSAYYKSGAGVIKSVLFLLSAVGVLCLFDVASLIGVNLSSLASGVNSDVSFITYGSNVNYGFIYLIKAQEVFDPFELVYVMALVVAALVAINYIIDIFAIGVTSKKGSKIFNLVRYGLLLVAAIATAIIVAAQSYTPGLYLYAVVAIALIQVIISIVRMFCTAKATEEATENYTYKAQPQTAAQPVTQTQTAAAAPASPVIAAPASSAMDEGFYDVVDSKPATPPVYTRNYSYQEDGFLLTLTPGERAEFFAIFIDKRKGNFYYIPDYIIGGENKEFFSSLFIYLGKFMGMLSDGLMNKIYRRLNLLDE